MYVEKVKCFDLAFNHASIGMAIMSLEGCFIQVNHSLCCIIGYEQQELLSLNLKQITHPDDVEESLFYIDQLRNQCKRSFQLESRYTNKRGDTIWMLITVFLVCDEVGQPMYFFSQFQNVTSYKLMLQAQQHAEKLLQEKDESFLLLLEQLPVPIRLSQEGKIFYENRVLLEMMGVKNESDRLGMAAIDRIDPSDHKILYDQMGKCEEENRLQPTQYHIRDVNGASKWVEGCSLFITFSGKKMLMSIFQDITRQGREEEEERMLQSEKLSIVGQLAAGIVHEIRNPLTSINGFIKLMRTTKIDKEQYYDIIESELKSIEVIANEMLILAKPNVVDCKRVDLIHLMEQVVAFMNLQAMLKNSNLVAELSTEPIWIHCEPNQIKQVVINLIKNAIDAMPSQGGNIFIGTHIEGEYITISIQDEGCGIPPDQVKKLGQPFFTTKDTGTGLGLMVSYNIIAKHGGAIEVNSTEGKGTTFTIMLPYVE